MDDRALVNPIDGALAARLELMRATCGGIGIIMSNALKQHVLHRSDLWLYNWEFDPVCNSLKYRSRNANHRLIFYRVLGTLSLVAESGDNKKNCYYYPSRRGSFSLADPELVGKLVQFLNSIVYSR